MTSFQEVLARTEPLRGVGDLRLVYEPSLLIGERRAPLPSARADLPLSLALVLCGAVLVLVLWPGGGSAASNGALVAGVVAALLAAWGTWRNDSRRARRGFVLNFETETLRIDRPSNLRGRPTTLLFPFDAVRAVEIAQLQETGPYRLVVELDDAEGSRGWEVLADQIQADDAETAALLRLRDFLRRAFGLRPEG